MKRKIDIGSIAGFIAAIGLVMFGILSNTDSETKQITFNPANFSSFWDVSSVAIVVGGSFGCLLVMFPLSTFAKIPKHLRIIFMPTTYQADEYITTLVDCAKKARTNGLLSLEENIAEIQDNFTKNSLQMLVDSVDPEKVKAQMEAWIENIDDRHAQECAFYDKGAALGPAFGMIGTLIGLINMLKSLENIETVGPSMSVALVTTFYGSLLANVLFTPISTKLQARHEEEFLCMHIVYEGVQAIQAGENPHLIQEKLLGILPSFQQKKLAGKTQGDAAAESAK